MTPRMELALGVLAGAASFVAIIGGSAVAFRWVVTRLIDEKLVPIVQALRDEMIALRSSFDSTHVRDTLDDHGQRIAATEARVEVIATHVL